VNDKYPRKKEKNVLGCKIHKNTGQNVKDAVKISKKKQSFDKQIKNKKISERNAERVFQKNKHNCGSEIKNAEKFY
jgi:hypothetical protein